MSGIKKNNEIQHERTNHLGRFGEKRAEDYLRQRGYRIVVRNFRTAIGRNRKGVALNGEIDLVAIKSGMICFIEVKARSKDGSAPETAVTKRKQRQITRTAEVYVKLFGLNELKPRFDVISVVEKGKRAPLIQHHKNYWPADKFSKKSRTTNN